jgi:hypothetical protein
MEDRPTGEIVFEVLEGLFDTDERQIQLPRPMLSTARHQISMASGGSAAQPDLAQAQREWDGC